MGNVKPGDIKYKNMNGDNKINNEDKVVIGSSIPRYTFGLNLGANYKGFDLSMFFKELAKLMVIWMVLESFLSPVEEVSVEVYWKVSKIIGQKIIVMLHIQDWHLMKPIIARFPLFG